MHLFSIANPFTSRLKLWPCTLLCCAVIAGPRVAGAGPGSSLFLPTAFTSLGANPFTNSGTCTINTTGSMPVLTLPDSSTITGVVSLSAAVFTFDSISIPDNVTVVGLQNTNSLPVALLSHGDVTINGVVDVTGAMGISSVDISGGAGGAAGPGGGGGGGGASAENINPSPTDVTKQGFAAQGGAGGVGAANGRRGDFGTGGDGGAIASGGNGTGGLPSNAGGGGAFGGNGGLALAPPGVGGTAYGDLSALLEGGSGGGGGGGLANGGGGGGGGGGAVEIGAVNQIIITGNVLANGGGGGSGNGGGGGGGGGRILINAAVVNLFGAGQLSAKGGSGSGQAGGGGGGRISILAATAIITEGTNLTSRVKLAGGTAGGLPGGEGVLETSGTICPTLRMVTNTSDNGLGSLRQAILDAASCPGTNTIEFAHSAYGMITLTSGVLSVASDLVIDGPGASNVVINGNYPNTTDRVFLINSDLHVVISGLTITNGNSNSGGGIFNNHATLTVSNCIVSGNWARDGGGGIYNDGFSGSATLTVIASTLSGNSSSNGAGIVNDGVGGSATATVVACTLNNNSANAGGGIFNSGVASGNAMLTVIASTLSSNSSQLSGGGILSGNASGSGTVKIIASTLSGNSAVDPGSAIFSFSGEIEIGDTILDGSSSANIVSANGGTVTSDGYNLSSDDGSGYLTGTGDQTNTNPMLGPLKDNGGPTFTQAPLCGSPAIDKGNVLFGAAIDQRGLPRPFNDPSVPNAAGGDGSDIGAVELQQICNQSPVAVCTNVTVSAGASCAATASVDGGSYDPDSGDTITLSQSPPGPYPLGTNSVTLTVVDNHNASNSCIALVIVRDTTPPVPVVTPLPIVSNQCTATVTPPHALDNCGGTLTGSTGDLTTYTSQGTFTVHWVYNDGNGNVVTQLQSVVVKDTIPPTITCPLDIISNTPPGQCGATVTWAAPAANDNCGLSGGVLCVPPSGSPFSQGTTKVTCTATDVGGNMTNCSFNVTVGQSNICAITVSGNSGGSPTICQGNTVILTAPNGMKHYLWTGPEQNGAQVQTLVVGTPGTYYCTQEQYYGSTNCCSVTVTVNPPPPCNITGSLLITNGIPTTLVGPEGMKNQYWTGPQNNGLTSRSNTVSLSGTYTLHLTDSNGCQAACPVTVANKTPAPCSITISGDAGGLTICQGRKTTLTGANGMSHYMWFGPEQNGSTSKFITVGTQGSYTVQQIDGAGLTNTCSVFLTVNPMPPVNISGPRTFCQGSNTTLSGPDGMNHYLWLGPQHNGLITQSNTVSIAGTYTLQITDSNGCQNALAVPVAVVPCP